MNSLARGPATPLMTNETIDPERRAAAEYGELVVRMIGKRGMQHHTRRRWRSGRASSTDKRIASVAFHPDAQRFEAMQQLKRIGGESRRRNAQAFVCGRA